SSDLEEHSTSGTSLTSPVMLSSLRQSPTEMSKAATSSSSAGTSVAGSSIGSSVGLPAPASGGGGASSPRESCGACWLPLISPQQQELMVTSPRRAAPRSAFFARGAKAVVSRDSGGGSVFTSRGWGLGSAEPGEHNTRIR